MRNPKFQIFKSTVNSQFYFRLIASNGEIILGSEGYQTKNGARSGIESVKVNAPFDGRYERRNAPGNYTFNLQAANGEVIGRSENYTTSSARETGIEAVKKDAPVSQVEDLT